MNGKQFAAALKYGYRSGLEIKVKDYLIERNIRVKYEAIKIEWEDLMYRTYTPDFVLPNGIIIETKGRANESFPMRWKLFKRLVMNQFPNVTLYKPQNQKECDKVIELILNKRK